MKDKKLRYYLPLGISPSSELNWLTGALTGCFGASLLFFFEYYSHYNNLFTYVNNTKVIVKDAMMPDFAYFGPEYVYLFISYSASMVFLSFYHYYYHFMGSKSIYTMKRLPSGWDLWRRCLTFPIAAAIISLIMAAAVLMLYFLFYMLVTPDVCLAPNQLDTLINVISGGVF